MMIMMTTTTMWISKRLEYISEYKSFGHREPRLLWIETAYTM